MNRKKLLCVVALAAFFLSACGVESELSKINTDDYVTLGNYKGLEVALNQPEVTEEYQQKYIDYILSQNAELKEVTGRAAQLGDTVNIDYQGEKDGADFDGGTAKGVDLPLGSGTFIPGFEDGLVGAKVGESRDLDLTFPENYGKQELAGQKVLFHVTVNKIQEKVVPELTDETVRKIQPECTDVESYKKYVYDLLLKDSQAYYDQTLRQMLVDKAMENTSFNEPPAELVEDYYQKSMKNMAAYAASYGMSIEDLVSQYYGASMEEFEEQGRESAKLSANQALMLQAIANAEKIEVSKKDIQDKIDKEIEIGDFPDEETLRKSLTDEEIRDFVMSDKVIEILKENAVVTDEK